MLLKTQMLCINLLSSKLAKEFVYSAEESLETVAAAAVNGRSSTAVSVSSADRLPPPSLARTPSGVRREEREVGGGRKEGESGGGEKAKFGKFEE